VDLLQGVVVQGALDVVDMVAHQEVVSWASSNLATEFFLSNLLFESVKAERI
jgi:hypothetical protein